MSGRNAMPHNQQAQFPEQDQQAREYYQQAMQFLPTLLRLFALTVAVFTRFHFGRYYISAHFSALAGLLITTGGMGAVMLMLFFAGFFNQQGSGLPLGVFLVSAFLLTMLHRGVAFGRAWVGTPELAMFPGKPWLGLLLPLDWRWIYIVIEPGLAFAVGYLLSRINWPLGLWIMSASCVLAAVGFWDYKTRFFKVLDARDAHTDGDEFTNEIEERKKPGSGQPNAPRRFKVQVNKGANSPGI